MTPLGLRPRPAPARPGQARQQRGEVQQARRHRDDRVDRPAVGGPGEQARADVGCAGNDRDQEDRQPGLEGELPRDDRLLLHCVDRAAEAGDPGRDGEHDDLGDQQVAAEHRVGRLAVAQRYEPPPEPSPPDEDGTRR
jgi:hypothetical protein